MTKPQTDSDKLTTLLTEMVTDSDVLSTSCYEAGEALLGYRPSVLQMSRARRKAGVVIAKPGRCATWRRGTPDVDFWKRRYASDAAYADRHREQSLAAFRRKRDGVVLERKVAPATDRMLREFLWGAKGRGKHEFSLTLEDVRPIWEAQGGLCALTGVRMVPDGPTHLRPTMDRIDNGRGYFPDNIQFCTKWANGAKNRFDADVFYEMCEAAVLARPKKEI